MAEPKILNLDELIDDDTQQIVIYKGKKYEVAGVTGEMWIKYLKTQQKRTKALESGDRAAQFEEGLTLTFLCVPGLSEMRDELLQLKLPILNKLADYVSEEWRAQVPETETPANAGDGSTEAGE